VPSSPSMIFNVAVAGPVTAGVKITPTVQTVPAATVPVQMGPPGPAVVLKVKSPAFVPVIDGASETPAVVLFVTVTYFAADGTVGGWLPKASANGAMVIVGVSGNSAMNAFEIVLLNDVWGAVDETGNGATPVAADDVAPVM
jgi:hypothetical protein